MKRYTLALISVLSLLIITACEEQPAENKKPDEHQHKEQIKEAAISWENLTVTGDTVNIGDTVTYDFVHYNSGWEPTRIIHATTEYARTNWELPEKDMEIGEQDTFQVTCTFKYTGKQMRVVNVYYDTLKPPAALIITVWVEE